jgi:hypothetical protein
MQEDRILLLTTDFEKNDNILLDRISLHVQNSSCENCGWTIHLVEEKQLTNLKLERKSCLLIISIEKGVIGEALEKLRENFDFVIKKSTSENLNLIMVYCEEPIKFE